MRTIVICSLFSVESNDFHNLHNVAVFLLFVEMQATPVFLLVPFMVQSVLILFDSSNSSGIVLVLMLYLSVQGNPFC